MDNRKAIKHAYLETARPMGIYRVANVQEGKCLIGTSVDLPSALNRVRSELKFNGHRNKALQADWNRLGEDAFTFEILETLEPADDPAYDTAEDLAVLESMWLEKLQPYSEHGYHPAPPR